MPIEGLTDQRRIPRLGIIRLGETVVNDAGKEYPKALDYFNFTDAPDVAAVFPGQCRSIYPVMIPNDDEQVFFPTRRVAYRTSGLFCACEDSVTAHRAFVPPEGGKPGDAQGLLYIQANKLEVEKGDFFEMPCPGDDCPYWKKDQCKNNGRLKIILPTVPGIGVYEIVTSSKNSIRNILNDTRYLRETVALFTGNSDARIAGIPLRLTLEPMETQTGEGKRQTIFVLRLRYPGNLADMASKGKLLASSGAAALLPENIDDVPSDLYPRGGAALDDRLEGAQPGKAVSGVVMPRRMAAESKPTTEPEKPAARRTTRAKAAPAPAQKPTPADEALGLDPLPDGEETQFDIDAAMSEPEPVTKEEERSAADEFELTPPPDDGRPRWVGAIRTAKKLKEGTTTKGPWTLYGISGADNTRFGTFSTSHYETACKAIKDANVVEIVYKETDKGNRDLIEIRVVSE